MPTNPFEPPKEVGTAIPRKATITAYEVWVMAIFLAAVVLAIPCLLAAFVALEFIGPIIESLLPP